MKEQASQLRRQLSAMDYDPGYFCKFIKDQYVRRTIKENGLKDIFDIGCDTCYMAGLLNYDKYDFMYYGIDVRESFDLNNLKIDKGQQARVVFNTLDYIQTMTRSIKFDCILLLDVIEHFDDKDAGLVALFYCVQLLKSGGLLFLSTPNRQGEEVNWPKYHDYEYTLGELRHQIEILEDLTIEKVFGWSMSDDVFCDLNPNKMSSVLPKEIERVLEAIARPEQSRDIMMVLRKK